MIRTSMVIAIFCLAFFMGTNLQALEGKAPIEKVEKGRVDFSELREKEPTVEVNVSGALLNMAANIVAKDEPKVAKMLLDLRGVFVRIFSSESLGERKPEYIVNHYEEKLLKEGWEPMVRVKDKGNNVTVLTITEENLIKGLFVANSDKNQLVLVNVFGNINPEDMANLAKGKLPIPGLDQLGKISSKVRGQKEGDKPQPEPQPEPKSEPKPESDK